MIRQVIDRLLYTYQGQIIVSAIFGLALGLLFHKACKGNCTVYYGPHIDEIKDNVFKLEDTCYIYKPHLVKCDNKKNILNPYNINDNPINKINLNITSNINEN